MNGDSLSRFLGGSPGSVFLRLLILSFVVGIILSALGLLPIDILNWLRRFVRDIWENGFEAIRWIIEYVLLGAAIVIPVWLIVRLAKVARR